MTFPKVPYLLVTKSVLFKYFWFSFFCSCYHIKQFMLIYIFTINYSYIFVSQPSVSLWLPFQNILFISLSVYFLYLFLLALPYKHEFSERETTVTHSISCMLYSVNILQWFSLMLSSSIKVDFAEMNMQSVLH